MSTGDQRENVYNKKNLAYQGYYDRGFSFCEKLIRDTMQMVYYHSGVHSGGTFTATLANRITLIPTIAIDGYQGKFVKTTDLADYYTNVAFENTVGIDYYIGLRYCMIPETTEDNPRVATIKEYRNFQEECGRVSNPHSVTSAGVNITLRLDTVLDDTQDCTNRMVKVYLTQPLTTDDSVAFETLYVFRSGGHNYVTTTGKLGQEVISTNPADYQVFAKGLIISKTALVNSNVVTDGVIYIGYVTGNGGTPTVFNYANQIDHSHIPGETFLNLWQLAQDVYTTPFLNDDGFPILTTPLETQIYNIINTDTTFSGNDIFTGDLTFYGDNEFNDRSTFIGDARFLTGSVVFEDGFSVTDGQSISGDIIFPGNLDLQGNIFNSLALGNVTIDDALSINEGCSIGLALEVGGDLPLLTYIDYFYQYQPVVTMEQPVEVGEPSVLIIDAKRTNSDTGWKGIKHRIVREDIDHELQKKRCAIEFYYDSDSDAHRIDLVCTKSGDWLLQGDVNVRAHFNVLADIKMLGTGSTDYISSLRTYSTYGNSVFIGDGISDPNNLIVGGTIVADRFDGGIEVKNSRAPGTYMYERSVIVNAEKGTWGITLWNSSNVPVHMEQVGPGKTENIYVTINFKNQLSGIGHFNSIDITEFGPEDAFDIYANVQIDFVRVVDITSTGATIALTLYGPYPSNVEANSTFYVRGTYEVHVPIV